MVDICNGGGPVCGFVRNSSSGNVQEPYPSLDSNWTFAFSGIFNSYAMVPVNFSFRGTPINSLIAIIAVIDSILLNVDEMITKG